MNTFLRLLGALGGKVMNYLAVEPIALLIVVALILSMKSRHSDSGAGARGLWDGGEGTLTWV